MRSHRVDLEFSESLHRHKLRTAALGCFLAGVKIRYLNDSYCTAG